MGDGETGESVTRFLNFHPVPETEEERGRRSKELGVCQRELPGFASSLRRREETFKVAADDKLIRVSLHRQRVKGSHV